MGRWESRVGPGSIPRVMLPIASNADENARQGRPLSVSPSVHHSSPLSIRRRRWWRRHSIGGGWGGTSARELRRSGSTITDMLVPWGSSILRSRCETISSGGRHPFCESFRFDHFTWSNVEKSLSRFDARAISRGLLADHARKFSRDLLLHERILRADVCLSDFSGNMTGLFTLRLSAESTHPRRFVCPLWTRVLFKVHVPDRRPKFNVCKTAELHCHSNLLPSRDNDAISFACIVFTVVVP
jgi:hypothetical protein